MSTLRYLAAIALLALALAGGDCTPNRPILPASPWPDTLSLSWPGADDLSGLDHYRALLLAQREGLLWTEGEGALPYTLLAGGAWILYGDAGNNWTRQTMDACAPDGWPSPDGPCHWAAWAMAPGDSILVLLTDRRDEHGQPRLVYPWHPGADRRHQAVVYLNRAPSDGWPQEGAVQ